MPSGRSEYKHIHRRTQNLKKKIDLNLKKKKDLFPHTTLLHRRGDQMIFPLRKPNYSNPNTDTESGWTPSCKVAGQ